MKYFQLATFILVVFFSLIIFSPMHLSKALFTSSVEVTNNNITTGSWPPPTPTPTPVGIKLIINHQNVDQFSQISDSAISSAASLKMMFRHASVGQNIDSGLNALATLNSKYNRTNWSFQYEGNPGWQAKVDDFGTQVAAQANVEDVLSMKFCYIDQAADWNYYRTHMEALMSAYPTKKFVWWTMPIMTSGDVSRDAFNNNLRTYASTHNIILFDIAAIESHDPTGAAITNNGYEALYSAYTSDGGHLTALGSQRVAQAFWVMMAKISGWSGPDSSSAYTRIDPLSTTVTSGQNFTVNMIVSNVQDLRGFQSTITFNPNIIQFVSASLNTFLNTTGRTAIPLGPDASVAGVVTYGAYTTGSASVAGPNGEGVIASFTFRGVASGQSNLNITNMQLTKKYGVLLPNGQLLGGAVLVQ